MNTTKSKLKSPDTLQRRQRTFTNAICISSTELNTSILSDYPQIMLQRIMESDTNFLSPPTPEVTSPKKKTLFAPPEPDENENPHPMDVFIELFLNSCPIFRQILLKQVRSVRKALPLILHPDKNHAPIFIYHAYQAFMTHWVEDKYALTCTIPTTNLPIVAFIRVGNIHSRASKSELLNKVLNEVDNCFFSRNCFRSIKKSNIHEGTVEINWFTPNGDRIQEDLYYRPVAFMNLRGDATIYSKQCKFLSKVCNFACIFFSMCDLSEDEFKQLEEIYNNCDKQKCILISLSFDKQIAERYQSTFSHSLDTINYGNNINTTSDDIRNSLKHSLHSITPESGRSLLYCKQIAVECGMKVDNFDENMLVYQTQAEFVCKAIYRIEDTINDFIDSRNNNIDYYLPLQGQSWIDFCEIDIQRYKRLTLCEYNANEKRQLGRDSQRNILLNEKPNYLVCLLKTLNSIPQEDVNNLNYIWSSLITQLDTIFFTLRGPHTSRSNTLTPFSHESISIYNNDNETVDLSSLGCSALIDNDARHNSNNTCQLTQSLPLIKGQDKIVGIEHVMREIAQFYITYSASKSEDQEIIKQMYNIDPETLPFIAARLLLRGYSLEILDGSVNHIPLTWIHSVLQSVSTIVGQMKRVFVVSMLGVQSSGKSTLFNTMFGVQFPVSSGRCTRGVYMQLVRIDERISGELGYNYVILIDTEGLRGNSLEMTASTKHDNELATFVVGLSDITIANINAEDTTLLQDILQIIALAFIRMRLTYSKPKCIFVHHNVNDLAARNNLQESRKCFIETLNTMTHYAAEHEHQSETFRSFNDVISFDYDKDVVYFPSPFQAHFMIPTVSKEYVKSAKELKFTVLNSCRQNKFNFETFSTWGVKLRNLWESILKESFAFHYLNLVEVKAHHQLEIELCRWNCQFSRNMATWASKAINKIMNVDCEELSNLQNTLKFELWKISNSEHIKEQDRIKTEFFTDLKTNGLFIKWKEETKEYFRMNREREKRKIQQDIEKLIDTQFKSFKWNKQFEHAKLELLGKHKILLRAENPK